MKRELITKMKCGDQVFELGEGVVITMYNNDPTKEQMYKQLFKKYNTQQIIVSIVELNELQKEIGKMLRKDTTDNIENLKEQIAEVSIMLDQLVYYFKIDKEDLLKIQTKKLNKIKEELE